jgi:hypothetical protein
MIISLEVPDYDAAEGIEFEWDEDSRVEIRLGGHEVTVYANAPGLVSLARHLLTLAQRGVPSGRHIHLNHWSGLAETSAELTLQKTE